jgi:hypothetical protein
VKIASLDKKLVSLWAAVRAWLKQDKKGSRSYFPNLLEDKRLKERRRKKWVKFSELVDEDKRLKRCPVCGSGEVVILSGDWLFPVAFGPYCRGCRTKFQQKRRRLVKGFKIIPPYY